MPGPRALLVPASFTGTLGVCYMALSTSGATRYW